MDWNLQSTFDVRQWRFTPRFDYARDKSRDGTGRLTQRTTLMTPSLLSHADMALPKGFHLPFTRKEIPLSNRIVFNSTVRLERKRSPVSQTDNTDTLSMDASGDYEIAKNLRLTLSGGLSRLWHKFLKQEDFLSYNFATLLTFQF